MASDLRVVVAHETIWKVVLLVWRLVTAVQASWAVVEGAAAVQRFVALLSVS